MDIKCVCVFAGSSAGARTVYRDAAQALGRSLAQRDVGLVYGGAGVGLMGAVADAVLAGHGRVTGVIPEALVAKEVAHAGLTELRVVRSMHQRKAIMAELADGFIALPGGLGTFEELFEVLTWAQLGLHRKPCALLNVEGFFAPLLALIAHAIEERFIRPEHASMVLVSPSPDGLLDMLAAYQPPMADKWIDRASV
jgi:uncharacterized protein (TIGR00730 family)